MIEDFRLFLLSLIEANLTNGWGLNVHFFHLPYLNDGSLIEQLWTYFALLVNMYALGFAIASVHTRFGTTGMLVLFIVATLVLSATALACTRFSWWAGIIQWFGQNSATQLASWTALVTIVCILVSYMLLRKASI